MLNQKKTIDQIQIAEGYKLKKKYQITGKGEPASNEELEAGIALFVLCIRSSCLFRYFMD